MIYKLFCFLPYQIIAKNIKCCANNKVNWKVNYLPVRGNGNVTLLWKDAIMPHAKYWQYIFKSLFHHLLFLSWSKCFSWIAFYHMWHPLFCQYLHHTMLTISTAEFIDIYEKRCAAWQYNGQANKRVDTADVEYGKITIKDKNAKNAVQVIWFILH